MDIIFFSDLNAMSLVLDSPALSYPASTLSVQHCQCVDNKERGEMFAPAHNLLPLFLIFSKFPQEARYCITFINQKTTN